VASRRDNSGIPITNPKFSAEKQGIFDDAYRNRLHGKHFPDIDERNRIFMRESQLIWTSRNPIKLLKNLR
jgi:hypothetical protein